MKILAVIPARGGSKGIPKKNIKLLGGKPLLQFTAEKALASKLLTHVILSTDSDEIAQVGKKIGLEVPFMRPETLAMDTTPTIEVLQHALAFYENQGVFFEAICILQPTTPFREDGIIDKAIEKFKATNVETLISVLEVPHQFNPHWTFEVDNQENLKIATGDLKIIPRRQELPKSYYRDGSIYIIKTNLIKEGVLFKNTIGYIESNPKNNVNLDTMEDWILAEKIINNF
ncbi:MAG: acylneuraminate cytidylyltransferase family protein [Flavobacterium sp.]|nr:acylneuraminate cytidylyltransferase family protein [Flavobacterium sp.]